MHSIGVAGVATICAHDKRNEENEWSFNGGSISFFFFFSFNHIALVFN